MGITKSIGKNTLGGGKKMNVSMHNYNRSTHDLSYTWRNTQAVGTLVPFMAELALPGDTFDIDLRVHTLTHPTIGPLFGSFKQQSDIFFCPIRLYNALLHNNTLNIGLDMAKAKLPQLQVIVTGTDNDFLEGSNKTLKKMIHPSCLLAYLGQRAQLETIPGQGNTVKSNAVKLIAYYDIFKNYYANKQESKFFTIGVNTANVPKGNAATNAAGWTAGTINMSNNTATYSSSSIIESTSETNIGALGLGDDVNFPKNVKIQAKIYPSGQYGTFDMGTLFETTASINTGAQNYYKVLNKSLNHKIEIIKMLSGEGTYIQSWNLEKIDDTREAILTAGKSQWIIQNNEASKTTSPYLAQFTERDAANKYLKTSYAQFGLALKTYQSDIFTNWVKTEWIDGDNGINAITAIDTSTGSFSLDTLNLSQKVYNMLNRIAVSDGSYNSWIETVYTAGGVPHYETPVYIGGHSNEIEFQEVVSQSATENEPLGTLAGRGVTTNHKGGKIHFKADEPGYIIGITSLTPRVDYFQGSSFDTGFETLNDLHKPALDGIGYQDRIYWTLNHNSPNLNDPMKSIGKQPAWIDYMTNYNKTYGNFAILENEGWMCLNRVFRNIDTYTTYIHPDEYNGIFADRDLDAMNFWVQIHIGIQARRVMSAKQIPNL